MTVVVDKAPKSAPTTVAATSYSLTATCAATLDDLDECADQLKAGVPSGAIATVVPAVNKDGTLSVTATWVVLA